LWGKYKSEKTNHGEERERKINFNKRGKRRNPTWYAKREWGREKKSKELKV